jgi:hypothetical protein
MRRRTIKITTAILLLATVARSEDYLTGTVKSSDGKPVPGVLVSDYVKESIKTDSQGAFRIRRTQPVLFLSLSGYEPLAVVPAKNQTELNVTLEDSATKTWVVPNCKGRPSRSYGLRLRFTIPNEAKTKVVTDVDYQERLIRYRHGKKKEWLVLWDGPTVSMGHPIPDDFLNAASFQERSISIENAKQIGGGGTEDARGVLKSGGLWRWTGSLGEVAEYRDVSPAAASYFDKIIDDMCNEGYPADPVSGSP